MISRQRSCFEILESRQLLSFAPFGATNEIATEGGAGSNDVATSRNGTYLVAATDLSGSVSHVTVTRYAINGAPIGGAITVFTSNSASSVPSNASVAIDDDGDAVVAYVVSENETTTKIRFNRIANDGTVSAAVDVDSLTTTEEDFGDVHLNSPSVSMGAGGAFFVGWLAGLSRDDTEARFRAFDASGTPRAATFVVNQLDISFSAASTLTVDAASDGNSAAFSYVAGGSDLNYFDVYYGRVNTSALIGSVQKVDNDTDKPITNYGVPRIAAYADGSYVLLYERFGATNTSEEGVAELFAERYNASSVLQGSPIPIAESLGEIGGSNAIEAMPDGGFVVAYTTERNNVVTLFAQRFDAGGQSDFSGPVDFDAKADPETGAAYMFLDIGVDGYGTTVVGFLQADNLEGLVRSPAYHRLTGEVAIVEGTTMYVLGTRRSDNIRIDVASSGTITVRNAIVVDGATKRFGGGRGITSVVADGYNGNDSIFNNTNLEIVARGGSGRDMIYGGGGADVIRGNTDADVIRGRGGDDRIYGDAGNDTVHGDDGIDTLEGGDGNDELRGDADTDRIYGGNGDDQVQGGASDDQLYGQAGNDRIYGDEGNDFLDGGPGSDFMRGGVGNDTLFAADNTFDNLNGDAGTDTSDRDLIDRVDSIENLQ